MNEPYIESSCRGPREHRVPILVGSRSFLHHHSLPKKRVTNLCLRLLVSIVTSEKVGNVEDTGRVTVYQSLRDPSRIRWKKKNEGSCFSLPWDGKYTPIYNIQQGGYERKFTESKFLPRKLTAALPVSMLIGSFSAPILPSFFYFLLRWQGAPKYDRCFPATNHSNHANGSFDLLLKPAFSHIFQFSALFSTITLQRQWFLLLPGGWYDRRALSQRMAPKPTSNVNLSKRFFFFRDKIIFPVTRYVANMLTNNLLEHMV